MAAGFRDVEELKQKVLRRFGAPLVCVELTKEQMDDAFDDAKRWFIDRVGGMPMLQFMSVAAGQTEITLGPTVEDVTAVAFPDSSIFQLTAPEIFDTAIPLTFLGVGGVGGFVGGYANSPDRGGLGGAATDGQSPVGQGGKDPWPNSGLLQVLQHLETSKRLLSADEDWEYDQYSRILRLYPSADAAVNGTICVEYLANEWEIACMSAAEADVLYRRLTVEVMLRLGEIRSKFDTIPVPGGDRALNGQDLISRAEQQATELDDYVLQRFKPGLFFAE